MIQKLSLKTIKSALLCAALVIAPSFSATASTIDLKYSLEDLGSGRYRYDYTLVNASFSSGVKWFSVDFDPSNVDEGSLVISSPSASDWIAQVLYSAPGLPAMFDASTSGLGVSAGQSLSGFSVEFNWLGSGLPASQAFAVYDPTNFNVVESGFTTTAVPEPLAGSLALSGLGFLFLQYRLRRFI